MAEVTGEEATREPAETTLPIPVRLSPWISTFASIATPITLALTGSLYICGWVNRRAELRLFGLDSGQFEESIQATLASGYISTASGIFILLTVIAVVVIFGGRYFRGEGTAMFVRRTRVLIVFYALTLALLFGVVCGELTGDATASRLSQTFAHGPCYTCYVYRFNGGRHVLGKIIAADTTRIAIFTRQGVFVGRAEELEAVQPVASFAERNYTASKYGPPPPRHSNRG